MGWFKKMFGVSSQDSVDAILPEKVKSAAEKVLPEDETARLAVAAATGGAVGGVAGGSVGTAIGSYGGAAYAGQRGINGIDPVTGKKILNTGRLDQSESDDIIKSTFARLGRIFTSPLGLTGPFSSGKQKVFS